FEGKIARNSSSIDPASRTLRVEVDVDNRSGQLLPGAYVLVHLKLPQSVNSVSIPANTLLFRSEGLRVGVVRDGRARLVPITIGRDYGNSVEVVSGLQPDDAVIVNPSDSLIDGTPVRVTTPRADGRAMKSFRAILNILVMLFCAGCMVGPDYRKPSVPMTPAYKEDQGWKR